MRGLREVIEALEREVAGRAVRRLTATLHCVVIEAPGQAPKFSVVTTADAPGLVTHALCIEVALGGGERDDSPRAPVEESMAFGQAAATGPATGERTMELLTRMFGPPGFDNAARASVFAEAIDALAPTELSTLLTLLRSDQAEVPLEKPVDPAVAMARTRIVRLLKLGPGGLKGGIEAMLAVFKQCAARAVIETIRAEWKTQSDWADATQAKGAP